MGGNVITVAIMLPSYSLQFLATIEYTSTSLQARFRENFQKKADAPAKNRVLEPFPLSR